MRWKHVAVSKFIKLIWMGWGATGGLRVKKKTLLFCFHSVVESFASEQGTHTHTPHTPIRAISHRAECLGYYQATSSTVLDDVENKFNIWNASLWMRKMANAHTNTLSSISACVSRCVSYSLVYFFAFRRQEMSTVSFTGSDKWSCYVKILCACISSHLFLPFHLAGCAPFSASMRNLITLNNQFIAECLNHESSKIFSGFFHLKIKRSEFFSRSTKTSLQFGRFVIFVMEMFLFLLRLLFSIIAN